VLAAQTFAEKLFARLQKANERLETRLAMMGVCSRAIGVHRLLLLNFYPFLQKYIQPHQLDVTRILAILVQVRSDASSEDCKRLSLTRSRQCLQCEPNISSTARLGRVIAGWSPLPFCMYRCYRMRRGEAGKRST